MASEAMSIERKKNLKELRTKWLQGGLAKYMAAPFAIDSEEPNK